MLKKLRRKFITIAMCSMVLVLGAIMCVINTANYADINKQADSLLIILAENEGTFPKQNNSFPEPNRMPEKEKMSDNDSVESIGGLSPEVPFSTRYFTVVLDKDGNVMLIDTGRIAAVSRDMAVEYAAELHAKGKTKGFVAHYKYLAVSKNDRVMYIFLDLGNELSSFYSFLAASVLVSIGGMIVVFLLLLHFSKIVLRPVAESYEKQKRFITDASHEIKTPLAIISANTEVLELVSGENEWTASISNQVKRLTALTERLVFLSRMDEENTVLPLEDFSLSDAVKEVGESFAAMALAGDKAFEMQIEGEISCHGDEAAIRQLVSLLLDNAMKYTNERGSIQLSLRMLGKNRELTVRNTVDDIRQGNLDILFERFYRLDSSRNSGTGGYGIGLSVAKAIVNAHKGRITARSEDGKSIVFTILL